MKASSSALAKVCGIEKRDMDKLLESNDLPHETRTFTDKESLEKREYKVYEVLTVVRIAYAMEAREKPKPVTEEELKKIDDEHPF